MKLGLRVVIIWMGALAMLIGAAPGVRAQTGALAVVIAEPSENQTFYAGPTSFLYSIQVTGWVTTNNPEPSLVRVRLDIIDSAGASSTETTRVNQDGSFSFWVTVNPEGLAGSFTTAEIENGCEICHLGANQSFPRGKVRLRATATEPNGRQAATERHLIIDRSAYVTLPVKVVRADPAEQPARHVRVAAATWLYLWRARSGSGLTDSAGEANVRVEVLSQSSTQYILTVPPMIVDGELFAGVEPVSVTIPPGATSILPVTLRVRSQLGQITGILTGANTPTQPIAIRAINRVTGASYSTRTQSGKFAFAQLPIAEYLIGAEGAPAQSTPVDLTKSPNTSVELPVVMPNPVRELSGGLREKNFGVVPFGWVTIEKTGLRRRVEPSSGTFKLSSLPGDVVTLIASAPGYYAQAQVGDSAAPRNDFVLTPRADLRIVHWGSGHIKIPAETQATIDEKRITLNYGWAWGRNESPEPLVIALPNAEIALTSGDFAIEFLPGREAWIYLTGGRAQVRWNNEKDWVAVNAGEMLGLTEPSSRGVPLDPAVIAVLASHEPRVTPIWEPTLEAQLRDGTARLGIGLAQVATFTTYLSIILVLILTPFAITIWLMKKRSLKQSRRKW